MDAPPQTRVYPRGHEDEFPEERGKPPARRRKTPAGGFPVVEDPEEQEVNSTGIQNVSANTGVPPAGKGVHPVVGSVPARTPRPMSPHSEPPEVFNPGDTVEQWDPDRESDVVHDLPQAHKGAADIGDPNPVEWRHVYAMMEGNFPDKALEWVKHSTWVGPVQVPWERVDDDSIDTWAASHQPDTVARFAREIAKGGAHTNPSVLVQRADHPDGRAIIIDGHHRAMARHFKLNKPVLAYVGTVPARYMDQALETHSSQVHQGSDPGNR